MKTPCPDEEQIADYLEGRLDAETVQEIEVHLGVCRSCMENAMISAAVLQGDSDADILPAPERAAEDAVRLAAGRGPAGVASIKDKTLKWIKDIGSKLSLQRFADLSGIACPAPVRSPKEAAALLLKRDRLIIGGRDARIDIERSAGEKALVKITFANSAGNDRRIRLTLKKGQREIASQLSSGGIVVFEDIFSGWYELAFIKDGLEVDSYRFEIKEAQDGNE